MTVGETTHILDLLQLQRQGAVQPAQEGRFAEEHVVSHDASVRHGENCSLEKKFAACGGVGVCTRSQMGVTDMFGSNQLCNVEDMRELLLSAVAEKN